MINLTSTSDLVRVTTSSTANIDVQVSWVDLDLTTKVATPGRTNSAISSATTTTICAAPSSGSVRNVKSIHIRNRHASTSNDVTVIHTDGTTAVEMNKFTLAAGFTAVYDDGSNWSLSDVTGRELTNQSQNGNAPTVNEINTVVLASDVINNNVVANTIADITGLSFSVTAGETYWFRGIIDITSAAAGTGGRISVSGPASPTRLAYRSAWPNTGAADTITNGVSAYDMPAAASASTAQTTGNIALIEGFITPSANGTVILRMASEVLSSAVTAKAGSILQWMRVI